jgi:RNA polymerase sigma factor (sigma-70 family)
MVTANNAGAGDLRAAARTRVTVNASELVGDLFEYHAVRLIRMVVQDAFLGLYRGAARLRDPANAVAYLRASVLNGCRSVLRSRKRAWSLIPAHDPPVWSAESAAMAGEDRREVLRAVTRLPRRQREVLVLRYYVNLTDQEIAADLGVTRGTVASTASRALAALGRELGDQP